MGERRRENAEGCSLERALAGAAIAVRGPNRANKRPVNRRAFDESAGSAMMQDR